MAKDALTHAYQPAIVALELCGIEDPAIAKLALAILTESETRYPKARPLQLLEKACEQTDLVAVIGFDPR